MTTTTRTIIATATGVALISVLAACGTTSSDKPATSGKHASVATPETRTIVSGYPVDRTAVGLATWPDLTSVYVVDSLNVLPGLQLPSNDAGFAPIVSRATAQVNSVLLGSAPAGNLLKTVFGGGTTPEHDMEVGPELSPNLDGVGPTTDLVIAGSFSNESAFLGNVLNPTFVYRLDEDGTLTSLLENADEDDPYPTFTMTELEAALANPPVDPPLE